MNTHDIQMEGGAYDYSHLVIPKSGPGYDVKHASETEKKHSNSFWKWLFGGTTITGGSLSVDNTYALLKQSYEKNPKEVVGTGFWLNKDLSNDFVKTYINPITGQCVVVHKGTQGTIDWGNNAVYGATGIAGYKQTSRYKTAEKIQKEAEKLYGAKNVTTLGHSQAGLIAELVGKDSKEIITYNKASSPFNTGLFSGYTPTASNQVDIRASNDPVSFAEYLNPTSWLQKPLYDKGQKINIKSSTNNPIEAHNLEQLLNLDKNKMIGFGRLKKYKK
jgi:hypothetical protein